MRSPTFVIHLSCFLQLVNVVAGNDVITFNQDELDEDNIETVLETEHFIQVVDRRSNKPPHNIAVKTQNVYQNMSPGVSSQGSIPQGSIPQSFRTPVHPETTSLPPDISYRNASGGTSEGRTPSVYWENMSAMSNDEDNEEELLKMDDLFLASKHQGFQLSLSRPKRAWFTSGGDEVRQGQFDLTEVGRTRRASNLDKFAVSDSLIRYLKGYFPGERIDAQVTNITDRTVYFNIIYDDENIKIIDLARALYALDTDDHFVVGRVIYAVSLAKLESTVTNNIDAAICFLCESYETCKQMASQDFACKIKDGRLFPFGRDQSDNTLPSDYEFATALIKLTVPIPYDNELVSNIYISINGIISFGEPFSSYTPARCPVFNSRYQRRKLLAPYWTDIDKQSGDRGDVFYQVYTKNAWTDVGMLRRANQEVNRYRYSYERNFDATVAIVVTWSDMPAWPVKKKDNERVTFQCVIISDGETSYVIYLYANGAMGFNPFVSRAVQVCMKDINLDSSRNNFYKFDRVIGNTGSVGHWFYKMGYVQNYAAKCYQWYQRNIPQLNAIYFWNAIVPACPCNIFSAFISFRWISSYQDRFLTCYDSLPQYGQIGRRCCYRYDSIENRRPWSGNLQLFSPRSSWFNYWSLANHELEDVKPKEWCCHLSNLCHFYYDARPDKSCQYRSTWRAFFFGDPHFSTLDKQKIIFNGLGEYRLLEVNTTVDNTHFNFKLQGRTCRAKTSDGQLSNATVFCALALLNTNKTSAEVSIHPSGNYTVIFINKQDFTVRFRDNSNFSESVGNMYIEKLNGSLLISTPDDIGLTVTLVDNLLDFSVELGVRYRNSTKGLLGNFNGDPSDDLIYPNGTTLPNTTIERRIFEYCQTWAVQESIFTYAPGENSSTYSDPSFVPIFLDEANATDKAEAEKICGGAGNLACIYDYIATRNGELARKTKGADETFDNEEKTISNMPPVLNGSMQLNVTVNQTSTLTLTGVDPDYDKFVFEFIDRPTQGNFTYTNSSPNLIVYYTPVDMSPFTIGVVAKDDKGLQSEVTEISIVACSNCSGHGSCNFTDIINTFDPYYSKATCECNLGYSGDDCEFDTYGCDNSPCPEGTNCTDIPADEEARTNLSYNCSSCPTGYLLDTNGTKCEDIDECVTDPNPCGPDAHCNNTIGHYTCKCHSGFRRFRGKCVDINECVENQHRCSQICINNVSNYTCDCYDGFQLSSLDFFNCTKLAIDPCQNITHANCTYGCRNDSGKAECFCPIGYRLSANGSTCEDINECDENLCSQKCDNSDGSYTCSCFDGYILSDDKLACDMCPDNSYGPDCIFDCNCRGQAKTCDRVKGCICDAGWSGADCDVDVNECEEWVYPCAKDKLCVNINGSFTCNCPTGYQDINGTCTNVDECLDASVHNCSQLCIDNPGSFACACTSGYNVVGNICQDIDECALGVSGCDQICRNMEGSFNCECRLGFVLDDYRIKCVKALDPCQDFNISCGYACDIVDDSPQCYCQIGYMLGTDNKTCIDINECTSGSHNCTDQCVNIVGSYSCSCPDGKRLANDNRSCEVCDDYHWGHNCGNVCGCDPVGTETCDRATGCQCKTGWGGQKCSEDKDECSQSNSLCPDVSWCVNTPGSFVCQCPSGFELVNMTCTDINECGNVKTCDHNCANTVGGYNCSCFSGFYAIGDRCLDIDECTMPWVNKCDQQCRNTQGSFACECYEGYLLNTTTRNTCYRDPSAKDCGQAINCSHNCAFENGQEICFCEPGYQMARDNFTCTDIDECLENPCFNGSCNNLNGSFACVCDNGLKLAEDGRTCQACEPGHYGKNCSSSCSCNVTYTAECVASNGTCMCISGWNGTTCSDDINECIGSAKNDCVTNAKCVNIPGSHKCVCEIGHFPTSLGECAPCDDANYGLDCLSVCNCTAANTADCDDINGTCTCKPGWQGSNCDIDVNECTNRSYCGLHEYCNNLNGSAECLCNNGYDRPNPGVACEDINECLVATLHNCTDRWECNNTVGAFECVCKKGYLESNGQCQDIDECADSTENTCNNDSSECLNTIGGFQCVCKPGYTKNSKGECVDIDECLVAAQHNCTDPRECFNTVGGFQCVCMDGYLDINNECTDIDECSNSSLHNCNASKSECINTAGGFECVCKAGYHNDSSGQCTEGREFSLQITLLYTDSQISTLGNIYDNTTDDFRTFAQLVEVAFFAYGRIILPTTLLAIKVKYFTKGSVVADINVYIDEKNSTNPPSDVAELLDKLDKDKSIKINDTTVPLGKITIGNSAEATDNFCENFNNLGGDCTDPSVKCDDRHTACKAALGGNKDNLTIGLAVGIPLFVILTIVVALLACLYVRRKRMSQPQSSTQSVDHASQFRNVVATRTSTKGSWGAPQQMYAPDNFSDTGTNESGNGGLIKTRQKGRSDFQDSAWFDNRGATSSGLPESRETSTEAGAPVSNFSWEYMFRLLEPHRDFEIQRPYIETAPNPTFIAKSKDSDSAA